MLNSTMTRSKKPKKPIDAEVFDKARLSFEEMMAEVQPFVKKSEVVVKSTEGTWCETSSLTNQIQSEQHSNPLHPRH